MRSSSEIDIRQIARGDRTWAHNLLVTNWCTEIVVSRGRCIRADLLPGFVATVGGDRVGLLTYRPSGDEWEIVTVDSLREREGIGTALLKAVRNAAISAGCRRLWLITTNDNLPAMQFYEAFGFVRKAVYLGAVTVVSRKLKPEIPMTGVGGVPIRDEVEYELSIAGSQFGP